MDRVEKLREAYRELKTARATLRRMGVFRRGGIGFSRGQSANLSDAVEFSTQHVEKAMELIAEVGKTLDGESSTKKRA